MKAAIYEQYGPPEVLVLKDIPKPTPNDKEVLVKVHATTVTAGDTIMRSLNIPGPFRQRLFACLYLGFYKPKRAILGMELAGEIEAVGQYVTRFKPGDAIFASTLAAGFGGYAEYKCLPESGVLLPKPVNLTYEQAAAVPGAGMTAFHCLKKGELQPGQRILIYGASGAVGTNAVQLAKNHFRAIVTGVCSTANLEQVKSLGAAEVIDHTCEDFTQQDKTYDVIFDAVGKLSSRQVQRARKRAGIYLNVHPDSDGSDRVENLRLLKSLIEAGQLEPVIDRQYPLEKIVEAHRYVDLGRKRGNVVIIL